MLTTAAVLGGLTALGTRDREARAFTAAPDQATQLTTLAASDVVARAIATTNVYAKPDRASELVAVLPSGQPAAVEARADDSVWLRVVYPPGSEQRGWAPAAALAIERGETASLPAVAARPQGRAAGAPAAASATGGALPDLTVSEVFVLDDGRLAVGIRNAGSATLLETTVPVRVTKAEGDILGVLQVGPTTLLPGARATVVTPVVVSEPGNYRIVLDAGNDIAESRESNNALAALLIPKG